MMNQQHPDHYTAPYPEIRRWTSAAYRSVRKKTMIHGLFEADVTAARTVLREHRARTGESLSFTAFLAVCLGKAVAEDKTVQAVRQGRKRLLVFEEVDVWIPIEHNRVGQKVLVPHIVRAANRKTFRAIHDEIRAAQVADIERAVRGPRLLPPLLFGVYLWLFWRLGAARPQLLKQSIGTVGLTAVGMFGKDAGWGVPPPIPTPLLVSVGGIGKKHDMVDGRVTTREYLNLTISVDHDIVDGAPAARFVQRLKELIESGYGLDDILAASEPAGFDGASQQSLAAMAPR